jgi:predicted extracellular nuclease
MFYNVENLFDILDEPGKLDDEFTPEGSRHWTNKRYYTKLNHIAQVITSVGGWTNVALVGLCEVENEKTIKDLTSYSPLRKMQYRYVVTESDDARGIDVALLYQRDQFKYLAHECMKVRFPLNPGKRTRDILHVAGQVISGDTLDVFVCHFPSKRGGAFESEPDRMHVASIVRAHADSLMQVRSRANIVIMGDFNDEPSNTSIRQVLNAQAIPAQAKNTELYNLFLSIEKNSKTGSYKYKDQWNFLDQIIVSGNLLDTNHPFRVLPESAAIFQAPFLLTEDKTHGNRRPLKTFHGYKYEKGFSDHLPVYVDFDLP